MDEMRARIIGADVALDSASHSIGGDSHDDELKLYPDDDDGDDWDFDDVPVDSHVDVRASVCRDFDSNPEICRSASLAVLEDASGVFILVLQNINGTTGRHSVMVVKADALECPCVVGETAAMSQAG